MPQRETPGSCVHHGGCAGLKQNPTIWTNKIRCTDAKRRAVSAARAAGQSSAAAAATDVGRNMVLARWGGMGSHRYQVGFSGDVKDLSWVNLAYQVRSRAESRPRH